MDAVHVAGLRKSYGENEAVKGISFEVPEGSFTAFLGPNGAGKSTTISIITSLAEPDSGTVEIFGRSPSEARPDIGVVFQDPKMDKLLTVRENVSVRASMYGISSRDRIESAIRDAGCEEFADRRYGQLSGGQRRRADIARAIVHRPRLLILDEPTTGLDPKSRLDIWNLVDGLNKRDGITVMLTTHYMEEAEGADDIVIIQKGEIIARGTPQMLRDEYCSDSMVFTVSDRDEAVSRLSGIRFSEDEGVFRIPLARTAESVPIIGGLSDLITSIEVRTGTLDEAFIEITEADE